MTFVRLRDNLAAVMNRFVTSDKKSFLINIFIRHFGEKLVIKGEG